MKNASLLLALVLFLFLAPNEGNACTCAVVLRPGEPTLADGSPAPTREALESYDAIFVGRVAATAPLPAEMPEDLRYFLSGSVTRFDVERFWGRRELGRVAEVFSPSAGGACGHRFQPGAAALVFARLRPGPAPDSSALPTTDVLTTDICTLTTLMPRAAELLSVVERLLGPGRRIVETEGRR